jgi:hypothetical protein
LKSGVVIAVTFTYKEDTKPVMGWSNTDATAPTISYTGKTLYL